MKSIYLAVFPLVFFAGCSIRRGTIPLKNLTLETPSKKINENQDHIQFAYQTFTENDCRVYLGNSLLAEGYQPVQFTIVNNTDRTLKLYNKDIELPMIDVQIIKDKVRHGIGWRIAFFTSCGIINVATKSYLILPFLTIPCGVLDLWLVIEVNKVIDNDYDSKTLEDKLIPPRSVCNGIIFVPLSSFDGLFNIALTDIQTNEKIALGTNETLHLETMKNGSS